MNMAEAVIREFKPTDYARIEEIWKETGLHNFVDSEQLYTMGAKKNPDLFLVMEKNGYIISTICGFFPYFPLFLLPESRIGYIGHLAVDPGEQGQGVGSRLLKEICSRLKAKGKTMAILFVYPSGSRVRELTNYYRKRHGFKNLSSLFYKKL